MERGHTFLRFFLPFPKSLSHPFSPNLQKIITPKALNKGPEICTKYFPRPECHGTHVICHVSGVRYQMSCVTSNYQTVRARESTLTKVENENDRLLLLTALMKRPNALITTQFL